MQRVSRGACLGGQGTGTVPVDGLPCTAVAIPVCGRNEEGGRNEEDSAMAPAQQRRGRSIAMTPAELDEFLAQARTCRVATQAPDGPHVAPLWFVWASGALWLSSLVRSQRWADLIRDPRVAVVVNAGEQYHELRGAEIRGTAEPVGEVPRRGADDALLATPELLFARKYLGGESMLHDGRHGWLRVTPGKITSWDFRKLPAGRARPGS